MPENTPIGTETLSYDMASKFPGTYRGIEGLFECTADCTVKLNEMKKVVTEGDMRFIPNSSGDTFDDPDTAYLAFGVWRQKDSSGTADTYQVQAYATAVGITSVTGVSANFAALTGAAKYVGEAAGTFVTKTLTAGKLTDANSGLFAAVSTLTADFGDATGTGSIEGTIDQFMNDGGVDSSEWEVTLEEVALSGSEATFMGTTEVSFGGDAVDGGMWEGTFYGNADETAEAGKEFPGMVAGTFDAHTGAANLTGGFGAHRQ